MDQSVYDAQQEREQTREALTQKIELLEERVRDSVEEAKVKVRQQLRVSYHVEQRPWQMLALSVVTGIVLGRVVSWNGARGRGPAFATSGYNSEPKSRFEPERSGLSAVKGAAAGVVTSIAVQLVKEGLAAAVSKFRNSRFGGPAERAPDSFGRVRRRTVATELEGDFPN
jgi:ElaB/YqjD/DUF883 family membrane-anchored ribosome-binding protein